MVEDGLTSWTASSRLNLKPTDDNVLSESSHSSLTGVEPTDALRSIETALRLAIRAVLGSDDWMNAKAAPDTAKLEERRDEEQRRRDGVVVSDDLLNFTEMYHLTGIIEKNWEQFSTVFSDRARTLAYFGIINDVRNSIAHSRDLVRFERDLLSGIAGQLRNQVALFRSSLNESSKYYPLIETVRDGFGLEGMRHMPPFRSADRRVEVGQTLEFTGAAFSARGKEVVWLLLEWKTHQMLEVARGDDVTFVYTFTERDVSETLQLGVLIAAESRFHRHPAEMWTPAHDDQRNFLYAVNPPEDE